MHTEMCGKVDHRATEQMSRCEPMQADYLKYLTARNRWAIADAEAQKEFADDQ